MNLSDHPRRLARLARRIERRYRRDGPEAVPDVELPAAGWLRLERLRRRLSLATEHGLAEAARITRRRMAAELRDLAAGLDRLAGRCDESERSAAVSQRSLLEELRTLPAEFENARFDRGTGELVARTAPISFDGVDLGPFEIRVDVDALGGPRPYRVVALEPHPSAGDASVVHPHVRGEALCVGDGHAAVALASAEGRVADVFLLLRQVLLTHNPGSAYRGIGDWGGTPCDGCGDDVAEDDLAPCEACGCGLCGGCRRPCGACGDALCGGCGDRCPSCDSPVCDGCLERCADCREYCCTSCLDEGRCPDCLDVFLENGNEEFDDESFASDDADDGPEDGEAEAAPPEAASASAVPPVPAGGVGEAPVPA